MKNQKYSNNTYNSKNPLARFSHRKRMKVALDKIDGVPFENLLDYGCGDGYLLEQLRHKNPAKELVGFEPVMSLEVSSDIKIETDIERLLASGKKFDLITCFEVLEHFGPVDQKIVVQNMHQLLADQGKMIVSVPIEIGFPVLIKNLRRVKFKNISLKWLAWVFRSFLGKEIPEVRDKRGYLPTHMGFSHKRLEKIFQEKFSIVKQNNSPFSLLPYFLNSQVFYLLAKK